MAIQSRPRVHTSVLHVRMPDKLIEEMEKVAAKKGMKTSEWVRWVLARVLEGERIKGNQST